MKTYPVNREHVGGSLAIVYESMPSGDYVPAEIALELIEALKLAMAADSCKCASCQARRELARAVIAKAEGGAA